MFLIMVLVLFEVQCLLKKLLKTRKKLAELRGWTYL